jgi:hypothetical protein
VLREILPHFVFSWMRKRDPANRRTTNGFSPSDGDDAIPETRVQTPRIVTSLPTIGRTCS